MKISYNWLKNYINTDLSVDEISILLTDCGLEVESVEKFQTIEGGLEGILIGQVLSKEKHPDADRLNLTTVNIGADQPLNIVCGASNVEAGQKVVVATIGATLYPAQGDSFQIKKSKIRGFVSEGMICAEDEIGLGESHDGIMVLNDTAKIGDSAANYFNVENDYVIEIGLTPNRSDACSHFGVARDLAAILNTNPNYSTKKSSLIFPSLDSFKIDGNSAGIEVSVLDAAACPRYSGISMKNVEVKPSPKWLQNRLKAIGIKSINNIVDASNYVMHELGQPLHIFDANKIEGGKIIVHKLKGETLFTTLDKVERKLSVDDLVISDATKPMCIAGVFGGLDSGVTFDTKNIFIESAYFNAVSVRKTAKRHQLKTDSSFRFERGTDPNMTAAAVKRAVILIQEIAGGSVSSDLIDIYPNRINPFQVELTYQKCNDLIGKSIEKETIKEIITSLGIVINSENETGLSLAVPPFKVDVQRDVDVVEEILRIYGYNNIDIPTAVNSSLSYYPKPDREKLQEIISNLFVDKGFNEIMNNSLVKAGYSELVLNNELGSDVKVLNPLSQDLSVLRKSIIFGGLESIAYNQNRKNADLKFFEFGKSYHLTNESGENVTSKYSEINRLGLWITGKEQSESWETKGSAVSFYTLKGCVESVLARLGITNFSYIEIENNEQFQYGLQLIINDKIAANLGVLSAKLSQKFDINEAVFFADFNWDLMVKQAGKTKIKYKEVSKFPAVRRDLALLLNKQVKFEQLQKLAYQTEKQLLKNVNLFDIYEGDKLPKDKKSYALSFVLQDENKTLNDAVIDKIMERLLKAFQENLSAELR